MRRAFAFAAPAPSLMLVMTRPPSPPFYFFSPCPSPTASRHHECHSWPASKLRPSPVTGLCSPSLLAYIRHQSLAAPSFPFPALSLSLLCAMPPLSCTQIYRLATHRRPRPPPERPLSHVRARMQQVCWPLVPCAHLRPPYRLPIPTRLPCGALSLPSPATLETSPR